MPQTQRPQAGTFGALGVPGGGAVLLSGGWLQVRAHVLSHSAALFGTSFTGLPSRKSVLRFLE